MKNDLEIRVTIFSKEIINICKAIRASALSNPIKTQLIRSATSVGANYFEANGASSKRDFRNKICICKKEAKETTYWLQIIDEFYDNKEKLAETKQEAHELLLIFSKIAANSK